MTHYTTAPALKMNIHIFIYTYILSNESMQMVQIQIQTAGKLSRCFSLPIVYVHISYRSLKDFKSQQFAMLFSYYQLIINLCYIPFFSFDVTNSLYYYC